MSKTITELQAEYQSLQHAMQSGIAMKMNYDRRDLEEKHLRVGVNSALIETGAIATLLLEKGIITEQEYWEKLCKFMRQEVEAYERWLNEKTSGSIKLG